MCRWGAVIIRRCAATVPPREMVILAAVLAIGCVEDQRSYPPLHRYRATLVVCQSLRAVSNAYAGEGV